MKKLLIISALSTLFLAGCFNQNQPQENTQNQNTQTGNQSQNVNTWNAQSTWANQTTWEKCDDWSTCKVDLTWSFSTWKSSQSWSQMLNTTWEDQQTKDIEKDLNKLLEE